MISICVWCIELLKTRYLNISVISWNILLCYRTHVMYITFNIHTYIHLYTLLALPRDHNGNKPMCFFVLSFWPDVGLHFYAYLCT